MKFKFDCVEKVFKKSNDKIKEYWLYSNEGKWEDTDCYLGAVVFYKNNKMEFVSSGGNFALDEVNYISKKFKTLTKK